MVKTQGYSIWFIPTGDTYHRLNRVVLELSQKYDTPYFEPHVTLIGGMIGLENEILAQTNELSAQIQQYWIEFEGVGSSPQYLKCMFLEARKSEEVMRANEHARTVFDKNQDPLYMPHLSLIYGEFSPEIKTQMIAAVTNALNESCNDFDVTSLSLIKAEGEPQEWVRIQDFPLLK